MSSRNIVAVLLLTVATLKAQPTFERVMITEVSWGTVEAIEIANFSRTPVDLASWKFAWHGIGVFEASDPLNALIQPGQIIVVAEHGSPPPVLPGTTVLEALPPLAAPTAEFAVELYDGTGNLVDEVRVADTTGSYGLPSTGGSFFGFATRSASTGSVERIWGLDADSGEDWTEQDVASMGLENRSSGPRGFEGSDPPSVLINEIDHQPDYIEIYNASGSVVNLKHWFLLCSFGQGVPHEIIRPFPAEMVVPAGGYVVIGNHGVQPAELQSVPYVDLQVVGGGALAFGQGAYDCALYDHRGRLMDCVRATGESSELVHNHPRAPSAWSDFVGAATRVFSNGSGAIGRDAASLDTNTGADWAPVWTRTMGVANWSPRDAAGHGHVIDVRANGTWAGGGTTVIINAGGQAAFSPHYLFFSYGHADGGGVFFGLGMDALTNWHAFAGAAPFAGLLDAQGSTRWDFPSGWLAPGFELDAIFYALTPGGQLVRTKVLAFDA